MVSRAHGIADLLTLETEIKKFQVFLDERITGGLFRIFLTWSVKVRKQVNEMSFVDKCFIVKRISRI